MDYKATHTFDAPIERVWEMFTDREAHVAKFTEMGHRDIEIVECTQSNDLFRLVVRRVVDVELPGFARKVLKPTNTVITTDVWRDHGDGTYGGDWHLETIGAPVDIKGTTKLVPASEGKTRYELGVTLKVNVPLIGGRIADWAKGDTAKQIKQEFAAGDTWLADHS